MLAILVSGLVLLVLCFLSVSPMVTADAVYTPLFNASDARRHVTGIGRSSFSLLDGYRDSFPVRTERVVNNATEVSDASYSAMVHRSGIPTCHYAVYSTVTAVESRDSGVFSTAGDVIELPMPGCSALRLANGALIAYCSLFVFAFVPTTLVYKFMYGKFPSEESTRRWGPPVWLVAVALNCALVAIGVLQAGAMWAFASDGALEHATLEGTLYAHASLLALYAALQAWSLYRLCWDMRRQ